MATKPVAKQGVEEEGPQVHRIRITLTSKNVKNLEKGEAPASSRPAGAAPTRHLLACTRITPAEIGYVHAAVLRGGRRLRLAPLSPSLSQCAPT